MSQKVALMLLGAVMALILPALPLAARAPGDATPPRPARINHLAYFNLTDESDVAELIADCDAMATEIPGIVSYFCGVHLDTGRATVEADYSVGFYVGFDSEEAYAAYVAHETHQALVAKWRPRLEWLRVHDVLDETP